MTDYAAHWDNVMSKPEKESADVLASLKESSIQDILNEHHKHNYRNLNTPGRYLLAIKRKLKVGTEEKEFEVKLALTKPLEIDFNPSSSFTSQVDNTFYLNSSDPEPELRRPNVSSNELMLKAPEVQFIIRWPKYGADDGFHEWVPDPILMEALGYIYHEVDSEYGHILRITPTLLKFTPPSLDGFAVSEEDDCNKKWQDLLLIILNVVAAEQTPKMVQSIKLPTSIVAGQEMVPTFLDISDDVLTVGLALDTQTLMESISEEWDKFSLKLDEAVQKDIQTYVDFEQLTETNKANERSLFEFDSEQDFDSRFQHLDELAESYRASTDEVEVDWSNDIMPSTVSVNVSEGMAIGLNEYFSDQLIRHSIPDKNSGRCENWQRIGPIKGRVCHWTKVYNANTTISGTNLSGDIGIDIGGKLEGCVKKFWDCSWKWACSSLSLSVIGKPGLVILLKSGSKGVILTAKITGSLKLKSNLPYPFNKIIEAFSSLVWKVIKAFLNFVISKFRYTLVPPKIEQKDERLSVKFSNVTPFAFIRGANLPRENKTYLGLKFNTEAGKA